MRLAMTSSRSALGPTDRLRAGEAARARLTALPDWSAAIRSAGVVAGFVSTRAEIDPAPLLDAARTGGARVAYPRIGAGRPRMQFHVATADQLRRGRFGIWEPEESSPAVSAAEVSVMVVPGLAFDGAGHRLGFGGGFYDEWLSSARAVEARGAHPPHRRTVGLAYDFQLVEECPAGVGDERVDVVVTDLRTIICVPPNDSDATRAPEGS